ncbi:hypothetical protein NL676_021323 [Syzygium grande]|nr:hypothetical protein NL676_021323 [Syzygium grande]
MATVKRKQRRLSAMSALRCALVLGVRLKRRRPTSSKGLPGILFVILDSYVDPEYKDYGDLPVKWLKME